MGDEARKLALLRYNSGEINILLSCRALDEGLNVPETDTGIIMSSTGSFRQRIQRVGRVLRKTSGSGVKSIYYMYIGKSLEEREIIPNNAHNRTINLRYDAAENEYFNEEYDLLCAAALKRLIKNQTPPDVLGEVKSNFKLGSVKSDWQLPENECRAKINASGGAAEKNYWISMLKIIEESQYLILR